MRIDKVYTRGGDRGETSLIGGERVAKSSARIECYGTVDEVNAVLGLLQCAIAQEAALAALAPIISRVQNELFNLGAELAAPDEDTRSMLPRVQQRHVEALEADIDLLNEGLAPLRSFVLPGGGWASSYCHHARTVCRRAERLVVALARTEGESVDELSITYLNRLSDALFVFGRWAVHQLGAPEPVWTPEQA